MDKMPIAALVLQSIPEVIIMLIAGFALTGIQISNNLKKIIFVGICYGIFSYFVRSLPLPFGIHTLIQLPLLILLIRNFLNISIKQSLIAVMIGFAVQFIIEIIYVPIISLFIVKPISVIISDPVLRILVPWPYMLFMLFIAYYSTKKEITIFPLVNLIGTKIFNVRYPLIVLMLLQIILLALINSNLLLNTDKTSNNLTNVHIYSIAILSSMVLSLYLVRKLLASVKKEVISESQSLFLANVNDLFLSLRGQRHDFINHVHTISGLLSINKFDLAKEYAQKLLKDTVHLNDVIQLTEPFLAALLRGKLAYADTNSIKFTIDTDTSLGNLGVDSFELTRIIGNLIDNAFDAVMSLEKEQRVVELSIKKYFDFYIFEIKNTGCEIPENVLKNIFTQGFTTKSEHSGLGLSIVKQLIDKNKGNIKVTSNKEETKFTIMLPGSRD